MPESVKWKVETYFYYNVGNICAICNKTCIGWNAGSIV
jgi:hypothetical protein